MKILHTMLRVGDLDRSIADYARSIWHVEPFDVA